MSPIIVKLDNRLGRLGLAAGGLGSQKAAHHAVNVFLRKLVTNGKHGQSERVWDVVLPKVSQWPKTNPIGLP